MGRLMIDRLVAGIREARTGMSVLTALLAVLMATHWAPLAIPALAILVIALVRPGLVTTPWLWSILAAVWIGALILAEEHMEDHVLLFCAWLLALAIGLRLTDAQQFVDEMAWYARLLVGLTFSVAVGWKLWFGDFVDGTALWLYLLIDQRFTPLARLVGLDSAAVVHDRDRVGDVLNGIAESYTLTGSTYTSIAIVVVSVGTLALEVVIALTHLAPDSSRLACGRLPSIVAFGVVTYGIVPVLPFAALLAVLAMAVAHWRHEALWIFPVLTLVATARLATLGL